MARTPDRIAPATALPARSGRTSVADGPPPGKGLGASATLPSSNASREAIADDRRLARWVRSRALHHPDGYAPRSVRRAHRFTTSQDGGGSIRRPAPAAHARSDLRLLEINGERSGRAAGHGCAIDHLTDDPRARREPSTSTPCASVPPASETRPCAGARPGPG